jgi:hypothetical protein
LPRANSTAPIWAPRLLRKPWKWPTPILDIQRITDHPDYFCAAPLSPRELKQYFGTDKPSRDDVQQSDEFWDSLDRGQARYVVLYQGDQPAELYFAGYSFD